MYRKAQRGSNRDVRAIVGIAGITVAVFAGASNAALTPDADIVVPGVSGQYEVTVEFVGSSAGWTGDLYFLGYGNSNSVDVFADDTNDAELGQWLMNNHSAASGDLTVLDGVFESGDVLHFAYDVYVGDNPKDLFRTDVEDDGIYFAFDVESLMLGIEDIRGGNSDWDYNDMEVRIAFNEVPAPATAGLLALAGCCGVSSRRRRS